jgi:cytochrome c peroxidase
MMQRVTISLLAFFGIAFFAMQACSKNDSGGNAAVGTKVDFVPPPGWPAPRYDFATNPLTKEGIELGRHLFYEGALSKDGQFPCASCHQQFAAFANFDHDLSHGFNNTFTTRNAPPLFNLAWQKEMHWDGGINHIEVQPLAPLTAPNEMAETIDSVLVKLRRSSKNYPAKFAAAFGSPDINSQRMLKALTQFMLTLVSSNSKFDKVKRNEASFSATEASGYALFKQKCESCHREPFFSDYSFRNIGLTYNSGLQDIGRMRVTGNRADSLRFKVPSLRNLRSTFPYMHDGRIYSVGLVLEHYTTAVINAPGTDSLVRNKIPLTAQEKNQLLVFLETLGDDVFLNDPRFAQPQ